MNDPLLFWLGLLITIVTTSAVVLVGRAEAQSPDSNRPANGSDGS
jgi:hypothetical protein